LNTRRRRKAGQRSHFIVCMDVELEIENTSIVLSDIER